MAYIELSQKNYFHNLDTIISKISSKDKLWVVLKDNAYGHGIKQISKMSHKYGITSAVVRNHDEAMSIKKYFKDILILNSTHNQNDDFIYSINSMTDLDNLKAKRVSIKINTKMNRNGILLSEFKTVLGVLIKNSISLHSIFTHYADASDDNALFDTQHQEWLKSKEYTQSILAKHNIKDVIFHSSNSAATFRQYPKDEAVRCGIALYGYEHKSLKPVLSLYAQKTNQIKLKQNQSVGYSSTFVAPNNMNISTYDIGYADGMFRFTPKHNLKTANKSSFLGICSMDFVSINSTDDYICIFDDASYLARKFGTISYEILVKLSPSITRIIK